MDREKIQHHIKHLQKKHDDLDRLIQEEFNRYQDDIAEEIRARGCIVVPDTVNLNAQGKNNSQTALVIGVGVYTWQANGAENGKLVVAANDGGYWYLQATGGFIPNIVNVPADPIGGVILYSEGGVLKYKDPSGTVKTINTTP